MSRHCCYLIMAGGTGGHIFPAMAVAKALREQGAEIHWLGTATGMEYGLVPAEDIPLHLVSIKGFRGKRLLAKCLMPFLLLSAIWQALLILWKIKPQVVVGFGGYVAAPGGIAARLLGKKLIIHEQNSVAGSTNKLLAKIASKTLEAFPGSLHEAQWVGNPIRAEVRQLFSQAAPVTPRPQKNLLIMGGSLGAEAINTILPEVIDGLPDTARPAIWHQTGKNKCEKVTGTYRLLNIDARVEEFIQQVEAAYAWADIIICRAGALTVSEVAISGVPGIFIPYPHAIDNHQSTNAQWLVQNEAALMLEQSELTAENLRAVLEKLLTDDALLTSMSEKLKTLAMPDATETVVTICQQLCLGGRHHAA